MDTPSTNSPDSGKNSTLSSPSTLPPPFVAVAGRIRFLRERRGDVRPHLELAPRLGKGVDGAAGDQRVLAHRLEAGQFEFGKRHAVLGKDLAARPPQFLAGSIQNQEFDGTFTQHLQRGAVQRHRTATQRFSGTIDRLVGAQVGRQLAGGQRQRAADGDRRQGHLRFQFQMHVLETRRLEIFRRQGRAEIELGKPAGVGLDLAAGHQAAVVADHAIIDGRRARSAGSGLRLDSEVVRQGRLQRRRPEDNRPHRLLGPGHSGRVSGQRAFERAGTKAGEPQVAQQERSGQRHGPAGPAMGGRGEACGRRRQRNRRQFQPSGLGQDRGFPPHFVVQASRIRVGCDPPAQRVRFVFRQQIVDEFPDLLFEFVSAIHSP